MPSMFVEVPGRKASPATLACFENWFMSVQQGAAEIKTKKLPEPTMVLD